MRSMVLSVAEALRLVLENTQHLGAEEVALEDALRRVLAEDVVSDMDLPPFDRSAMDGFALRAEDVARAPVKLPVSGILAAGAWPERGLDPGHAIQIMTGAAVPAGATAVQPVERTRSLDAGRQVEVLAPVEAGANIARRGSEVRAGDVVLPSGRVVDSASVGVLAAAGRARVRVSRRPSVAVLVTGDELVAVAQAPGPGRIRNSNGPALAAQAQEAGAVARSLGVVPDSVEKIAAAVREGLAADVLVVSGGVSAGVYDLVEDVFARLQVRVLFDRVALKPGAPLVFGRHGQTLVFGLPGNPVSAQVTFDLFVRTALLRMQGASTPSRPSFEVELLGPVRNRSGREAYLPARVCSSGGRLVAEPIRSMGSADLVAHARANAMLVLPADRLEARAGEKAPAWLLGNFLERDGAA
jgi:molybdopterin molybdotransferase